MTLHAAHANAEQPIPCTGCHEKVADQYLQAESWRCKNCHTDEPLVLHKTADSNSAAGQCWSCHDFTATDKDSTLPCNKCHAQAQGASPAIHPHDPKKPDEDCTSCHRAHKSPSLVATKCETCHEQTKVSGHARPDIPITGCGSCHGYHEKAETASTRCTNCHRQSKQRVSQHATWAGGHEKCVTCHRPHKFFKNEVIGCRDECHQNIVAISEDKVAKHRGCLGCHDNHDVRDSAAKSCVGCHKFMPKHPKDHDSKTPCIGCHKPHEGRNAPLAVACTSCHTKKASSDRGVHHATGDLGPSCRNCHKPHDFDLKTAGVALCRSCHGDQPFQGAKTIRTFVKHSDCFQCHTRAVAHRPDGPKVLCISCHKDKGALVRKEHSNCVQCHNPHTTKQKYECGHCHKEEASIARKDHKLCVNCHEPHSTKQKKPCGSCHPTEFRTAPEKHKNCLNCHNQHSTLVKRPCASCHTDRATGIHAKVPGGCINCHRPHGPKGHIKPPACLSCHDRSKLPGLHAKDGHKECTKCHVSHGEQPYRKTTTCLGCHKDRVNHEPNTKMCIGCHVFRGSQ